MAPQRDAISVRTTRLNNLILGRNLIARKAASSARASINVNFSAALAGSMSREGLLDAFCLLYNECDKETLKKRDRNIAEFVNKFRPVIEETRRLRVNTEDFAVKSLIGKGYFGNVHLVVERQTGDVYAMKKIKKSVVTTSQVKEERDIMSRRCSEWITNLQYAFQDADNLYLVMEFLPGGDLLSLMNRHGAFDEELARFYLAELTLAIQSLHDLGYVHRDIKPENILIDRFGHIKLADFGNAAALDRDGHVFSLSPVGTPDYIAPELLQTISTFKVSKSMHDVNCDFWSMGIIGYELICEITPFHEDNVHETYSKILSHCEDSPLKEIITFPSDLRISNNFKNLIESLVTNPTNRLGYEKIRAHPFFEAVKWDTLRSQVPAIIPTVNSEDDTSNFEDISRHKARTSTFHKMSITATVKSNDFSGKDLPFIGYSFVHMETQTHLADADSALDDARFGKLNSKVKELHIRLKERVDEISKLKQQLLRAEQTAMQSDTQSKILQDTKEEIIKMKSIIKEKTLELAACKTQIKTLQSSVRIDEEMWQKKESTITELLRMNRQKYEEAKIASEQRYEKLITEKTNELAGIVQKLGTRESELTAKTEECMHLQEKMDNYKEMLRQIKEQAQADKKEFEKNKMQLSETYEQKLSELRNKLRNEKDTKSRLTMELRDVRTELDDSISSTKSTQEAKNASLKSNDEILKRLNREIEANNKLHTQIGRLEQQLVTAQRYAQDLQSESNRLERELQVAECGKNLAESTLATQSSTPYETAPGSLTELHAMEEQLRADLEVARDNENMQKARADKLQQIVEKLEEMMGKFNEQALSPTKPHPAPRHVPSSVGDMLEKQNEKLEDKLTAVRDQMILERQAARTASLALWKVEKRLEETEAAHKMTQRRMELTEERIKKVQAERDEAQRLCKVAKAETELRNERITELKDEIAALKQDLQKEHRMWEKAEEQRMKSKSEIIEHISSVHRMEEKLSEMRQKLQQTNLKCDTLGLENKRLIRELNEERDKASSLADNDSALQLQLKNLQDNYERLKYACTITDNQLTEVEGMLEAEQKRNKVQQEKIDNFFVRVREKDEAITQLKKELNEIMAEKKVSDLRTRTLNSEIDEQKAQMEEMQKKLVSQQEQLMELTSNLFASQERVEVLSNDTQNLQTLNANRERELTILKEENTRVLSDLFHAKEETHNLQLELREALVNATELQAEIEELQEILSEKEQYYLERDIKSEATLSQHKKLIDYLQLKVEDMSLKKKKTLADKLFGTSSNSARKENISPAVVESSILYRTLQEELRREKQRCKTLQEQIDKLAGANSNHATSVGTLKSPLKTSQSQIEKRRTSTTKQITSHTLPKSPQKQHSSTTATTTTIAATTATTTDRSKTTTASSSSAANYLQHHRFELALQETNTSACCIACKKPIIAGSPYWKCRECKSESHRKCRSNVSTSCDGVSAILAQASNENVSATTTSTSESDLDTDSMGKYSYEAKLDTVTAVVHTSSVDYGGKLIYCANESSCSAQETIEVNCAYEIEEQKTILLGCNSGLYAYHIQQQRLMHIAGIDSVSYIDISESLAKAILVGSDGESLYQCDFRQLQSRSQANAVVKTALEASVLDLPFANRATNEKWQLIKISNEAENALDSVAIAATSTRIVILKYDHKMQKFKPVRALDTATPVSSVLYTRHTAIVASDKFYEIDLDTYAAEEFLDLSDQSLLHTSTCQPVVAIRISRQEFLLCFMEFGIFVDEYGCRSRPYDLNWEYTPTGFMYREPFLYIAHFQSVEVLRLHRSYTKEIASTCNKDIDADVDDAAPSYKRAYLQLYMPTLLATSGKLNTYALAIDKETGLQRIYHLDALQAFKEKFNDSLETVSSIATSLGTRDSL